MEALWGRITSRALKVEPNTVSSQEHILTMRNYFGHELPKRTTMLDPKHCIWGQHPSGQKLVMPKHVKGSASMVDAQSCCAAVEVTAGAWASFISVPEQRQTAISSLVYNTCTGPAFLNHAHPNHNKPCPDDFHISRSPNRVCDWQVSLVCTHADNRVHVSSHDFRIMAKFEMESEQKAVQLVLVSRTTCRQNT